MNELYEKESVTQRSLSWYKVHVTSCTVCFKKWGNILQYTRHWNFAGP